MVDSTTDFLTVGRLMGLTKTEEALSMAFGKRDRIIAGEATLK